MFTAVCETAPSKLQLRSFAEKFREVVSRRSFAQKFRAEVSRRSFAQKFHAESLAMELGSIGLENLRCRKPGGKVQLPRALAVHIAVFWPSLNDLRHAKKAATNRTVPRMRQFVRSGSRSAGLPLRNVPEERPNEAEN